MTWLTPELAPSLVLVGAWLLFMRTFRFAGYALAAMSLPGTILHEASHWLLGKILGARPVEVSLWPKRRGDYWVLGSVGFTNLTVWNAAFVAFAPLLLVPLAWLLLTSITVPAFERGVVLPWFVSGYVVACCLSSCLPSMTDVKAGAGSAMLYGAAGYVIWLGLNP